MPKPEARLREIVPALTWEMKMLGMCSLLLMEEGKSPRDPNNLVEWTLHNALLDAIGLHGRVIYDFLFGGRTRDDDALAEDFTPNWPALRPRPSPQLTSVVKGRVNKELAHLTYTKVQAWREPWPTWAIADELVRHLNSWLDVAPSYVQEATREYLLEYHRHLRSTDDT